MENGGVIGDQTIKISVTLKGYVEEFTVQLFSVIKLLISNRWSLDISISEDGAGWMITGYRNIGEKE